jgi:hypothetical protein
MARQGEAGICLMITAGHRKAWLGEAGFGQARQGRDVFMNFNRTLGAVRLGLARCG